MHITKYRGFEIRPLIGKTGFGVYGYNGSFRYTNVNTGWSGKAWVDEFLLQHIGDQRFKRRKA